MKRSLPVALLTAMAVCAAPAVAHAERIVTLPGFRAPGTPAKYDKVQVVQEGPSTARNVLVLSPGTSGGAGYFVPDARDLVKALPGWQVWLVERRENLLEDHSMLDRAMAGQVSGKALFDYYLGWIGDASITDHFRPPTTEQTTFARRWGLNVAIEDLHRVVTAARKGGRRVVLGGHSLGGSITTAYATWDFRGRAGAKDLAGLVLIDGGSGGGAMTVSAAKKTLADIDHGSPFLDLAGNTIVWSAGAFSAVGSTLALKEPDQPSILQQWPLFPADLKPPVLATNRAGFGYALDSRTGPANLALVQAHIGHLAATGDPRGWVDDGYATVDRAARALNGIRGSDGTAWFHPRRLSLDAGAIAGGVANPTQSLLGVHATHGADVHLPIYAISTSLGAERVVRAARALARRSHVSAKDVKIVDDTRKYSHCDPLFDDARTNDFLKTVEPFLRRIGRR
ncbi:hypothetical protein NBH00_03030 [Paraconexibacter antarcticus]|uniref:Alpha/beta fold hydrolase n=1 Tax=Paraconexibacter antarcticus TaxID=2949664 RepID=A0ABY5DX14_9ACTN|nr:hypothetical protein [Paraconexibacter antarcticus]UTI65190.1 hypothetical protein NBH00_03030 [Paraconexibacter antarcticus]